jgi:ZIP family zinc transporter
MNPLAIALGAVTMLSTLAGGAVAIRLAKYLGLVLSLTGGMVVAVALIDVLPEAIRNVTSPQRVGALAAAGFVAFLVAEQGIVLHHRDDADQAQAHRQVGALGAAGLTLHSFVDGLAIGLAFQVSHETGVVVAIAVIAHDFADGMNTVSFVLAQGNRRRDAIPWLVADAVAPLAGIVAGSLVEVSATTLGELLAAYAGVFLYIGASDLLPRAHEHATRLGVALTCAGFAFIYLVVRFGL